jgi:hypothetical protein
MIFRLYAVEDDTLLAMLVNFMMMKAVEIF